MTSKHSNLAHDLYTFCNKDETATEFHYIGGFYQRPFIFHLIELKVTDWDNEPKSEYVYLDKIDEMSVWLRI